MRKLLEGADGMIHKGPSAYNQENFLANYLKRRKRVESPNNAIEKPILMELIQTASGQDVLDLGCGDAVYGLELLDIGAKSYTGVEGAAQMAELAKSTTAGTGIQIINESLEAYQFGSEKYDLVTSRFVIHYLQDIEGLFAKVYAALKEKGRFIFSVQHPLTTSSFKSKEQSGRREDWIVDDYFIEGERNEPWIDKTVRKYHWTTEYYITALLAAGFQLKALREGKPERSRFATEEEYIRRTRVPIMLIFSCEK